MSLLPHRLFLLVPPWLLDPDARDFISRVEAADGNALENGVKIAYSNFIRGCKADGTWNAIKASCILAGARTLSGALVPMVGTAPTNFNFVSGDYNRRTGLVGNGTTKYLNSNRANNADPQNSQHLAAYISQVTVTTGIIMGGRDGASPETGSSQIVATGNSNFRIHSNAFTQVIGFLGIGLAAASRPSSSSIQIRYSGGSTASNTTASEVPSTAPIFVFARPASLASPTPDTPTNARLAFYSIGESLDLALLDARVTDLINAIARAI